MTMSPGTLFRFWFEEVWNKRAADLIPAYFAEDGVAYALDAAGGDAHGPEAFRAFFETFHDNFSDVEFTVHDVLENGDWAAGRWTCRLTHSGDGFGAPATGETLTVSGMTMMRAADGKILEGWNEWDRLKLATTCRMVGAVA
ncbi:ester cyclase [Roseococcus sp. YIM B11640]|uniref:ester cyclase n=1 Tax=Roseococcus sp. YIM B11640 TaxID=3133973 RepID=UPI003C7E8DFB